MQKWALGLVVGSFVGLAGSTAWAQPDSRMSTIVVTGVGKVETPPATANLTFSILGEGSTSEAATADFLSKRNGVEKGLNSLGIGPSFIHSDEFSIAAVRGKDCDNDRYSERNHLSVGVCAVVGYIAKTDFNVVLAPPEQAGTAVALAGKLGAQEPKANGFEIADQAEAHQRAAVVALSNAHSLAQAIASGSGVHLGRLVSVQDGEAGEEIVVTANRRARLADAPVVAVHEIVLTPKPIETTVRLTVTYAIAP